MYRRPDLSYFAVQTVFYGLMALTTRRFVFLWGPSMCILAGAGVCDTKIWDWLATTLRLPNTVVILVSLKTCMTKNYEIYSLYGCVVIQS